MAATKFSGIQLRSLTALLLVAMVVKVQGASETVNATTNSNGGEGKLIFAHVLFRHGDRTPIDPYPNDPWKDPSHWTADWGQLVNAGKMRHLMLGKWLRQRYSSLLKDTYSNNEIYVRSTDVDRTLMSAEANLAGLYPPTGADVWDSAITWQPIPVHTVTEELDSVLAAKKRCPAFDHALKVYRQSEPYHSYNASLEQLYRYVTEKTGRRYDSMSSVQNLYSALLIEDLNNFTLPEWTRTVYPEPLKSISAMTFAVKTNTTQLARLKMGPLVKEMLQRFRSKAKGSLKPNRSVWIYSAHDVTVASLLNALRVFELHNPPFAACIMLELRQPTDSEQQPYVEIFYKNTTAEPFQFAIPDCGVRCPLDKMFEIYDNIMPKDWESECQLSLLSMSYVEADLNSASSLIGIVLLTAISMLVLLAVVAIVKRRNNMHSERWYLRIDG
ncbi:prostatic acid phosphatase [Anopheles stephensi]|uniref:prostatic acid phosphatase n=1 Tax=Anopheles stephensi TaxID=30069 RepID=UPI00165898A1|nr:prostatic acid phosphatase [Anopheles stephensi]XP_035900614.1 prostatic acid phosphatase [Anopheles stephensi]XP_035900615.1 prostatic acid phosphatase [Anopheles stephensi]XP_035900616.1 prostatic acid phosphatase [Anopheles stephensi]